MAKPFHISLKCKRKRKGFKIKINTLIKYINKSKNTCCHKQDPLLPFPL